MHHGHYKLYNLCAERKYDRQRFYNRVAEYPFDDHCPPPFDMIEDFCRDVVRLFSLILDFEMKEGKKKKKKKKKKEELNLVNKNSKILIILIILGSMA